LASTTTKAPGTAKLDTPWAELGFEFRPTNSHVTLTYKDGEWGKPELVEVRIPL
jgi:branched-chain amino acid aminotransferase